MKEKGQKAAEDAGQRLGGGYDCQGSGKEEDEGRIFFSSPCCFANMYICGGRGKDREMSVVIVYITRAAALPNLFSHCRVHPGSSHEVKYRAIFVLGCLLFVLYPVARDRILSCL